MKLSKEEKKNRKSKNKGGVFARVADLAVNGSNKETVVSEFNDSVYELNLYMNGVEYNNGADMTLGANDKSLKDAIMGYTALTEKPTDEQLAAAGAIVNSACTTHNTAYAGAGAGANVETVPAYATRELLYAKLSELHAAYMAQFNQGVAKYNLIVPAAPVVAV